MQRLNRLTQFHQSYAEAASERAWPQSAGSAPTRLDRLGACRSRSRSLKDPILQLPRRAPRLPRRSRAKQKLGAEAKFRPTLRALKSRCYPIPGRIVKIIWRALEF